MATSKIVFFEDVDFGGRAYACSGTDFNLAPNMPAGIRSAIVVRGEWHIYPDRDLRPESAKSAISEMGGAEHDGCYPDLASTLFPPQSVFRAE